MCETPPVSICMPIYNRNNFKQLILWNITQQSYPHDKLEFCIDDDGTDPFLKNDEEKKALQDLIHPIKLNYKYHKHRKTIGAKRNDLTKQASYKIIACMDSDDIYLSDYIRYSVDVMISKNATCVGSNQMLFVYPLHNFSTHAIRCESKRQIHEACMVYTVKHHRSMGGFKNNSQGEGSKMADFNEKNVAITDIDKIMICIVHPDNTIDKEMFRKEDNKIDIHLPDELKDVIWKCVKI
jgi:glycosyltransferase involved in cell wall biosynthesis